MTVTYVPVFPDVPGEQITVPKLHKVVYGRNKKDGMHLPNDKIWHIESWLEENCCHPYYHSPGYTDDLFIEFECDKDAVWFALRWA